MTAADFARRLVLGTAQFGLDYGINNTSGRPDDARVRAILTAAAAAGIPLLDTAAAYGDSEARLGAALAAPPAPFELITKLAAGPAAAVARQLAESLQRLGGRPLAGVMFHSFAQFRAQPAGWAALQAARAAGQVARIGVSLYHPEEAEWLLAENFDLDLVQVPFNVLDQRFGPLLPRLAARGVEVHVRSVFLQGLLLRPLAQVTGFFRPLQPKLATLQAVAAGPAIPLEALLLLFVLTTPGVARVVIGVDSVENLHANLAAAPYLAAAAALRPQLTALAEPTDEFILPYTWPPRPTP